MQTAHAIHAPGPAHGLPLTHLTSPRPVPQLRTRRKPGFAEIIHGDYSPARALGVAIPDIQTLWAPCSPGPPTSEDASEVAPGLSFSIEHDMRPVWRLNEALLRECVEDLRSDLRAVAGVAMFWFNGGESRWSIDTCAALSGLSARALRRHAALAVPGYEARGPLNILHRTRPWRVAPASGTRAQGGCRHHHADSDEVALC